MAYMALLRLCTTQNMYVVFVTLNTYSRSVKIIKGHGGKQKV